MRSPRSRMRIIVATVLLLAVCGLGVLSRVQRQTIANLREQWRDQSAQLLELDRLREEIKAARQFRDQQAELDRLRESNNELLRLRNEMRQLREQLAELETLRAANARLLQAVQGAPALPSNQAAMVMSARRSGSILGIAVRPPVSGRSGAEVTSVGPNSPVATSGLAVGDIIYAIDGRRVQTPGELQSRMLTRKPGETVVLDVLRNETQLRLQAQTQAWPQ